MSLAKFDKFIAEKVKKKWELTRQIPTGGDISMIGYIRGPAGELIDLGVNGSNIYFYCYRKEKTGDKMMPQQWVEIP